jgi:xylose isomerase
MKQIKFNKKQENNQLVVDVELPHRIYAIEPVIEFTNSDMIAYLKESGVTVEDYKLSSQTNKYLTSYGDTKNEPILTGTWTFEKTKKVSNKVNKKPTRTSNKKEDKSKTGD